VAEFRSGCSDLEQTLDELFQEVDHLRVDFADRVQELELRRVQLETEHERFCEEQGEVGQLAEKLARCEHDLSGAQTELESLRAELTNERAEGGQSNSEKADQLAAQIAELENEQRSLNADRQQAQDEWQQAQQELARLSNVEQELNDTRQQLASAQDEMAAAGDRDAVAMTMPADHGAVDSLQQEREALEAELELVRGRAAGLGEMVADQKRAFADERAELSTELKALRRLVEKQAEMLVTEQVAVGNAGPATPPAMPVAGGRENDPVVSSVMAQFAKLQKDVAQRRRRRG